MDKESELLDNVVIFLVILVSAILVFSQYQFLKISVGYLNYVSIMLVLGLIGLIAWMLIDKKPQESHHEHHTHHATEHSHEHAHHDGNAEIRHETVHEAKPWTFKEKISYALVALVAILILFNQVQISQASALLGHKSGFSFKSSSTKTIALTGDPVKDAISIVIPTGTPFYGDALGISFDKTQTTDPIKSLEILAQLDPAYGRNKLQLTPDEKVRYIKIGTTPTITCEFCCGVKTAVTKSGGPACGCKHVWAMRGLMAYLIKNYPDLTDDQVIYEVARWKGLFFPKQMVQRYIQEIQTGQYTPDIAALLSALDESKVKDLKEKAAKSPVASGSNAGSSGETAATLNDLPSQVGGC